MTAPLSTPLSPPKKTVLLAAGLCAIASPVAAGWLTSPAGQRVAARATEVVSRSPPAPLGPARADDAAPTPVATSAPEGGGTGGTIALVRDGATSAPAANTGTAPPSSAQDAAGQAQPVQEKGANGAGQATAPTLEAALEPAVAARVASQTPGRGTEAALPGQLASMQARQISNEETLPGQWPPARGPLGPGPYLQVSGMQKSGYCGAWSAWYAVTTPPIAEGRSIRNFRFALRGDRQCGARHAEDVHAECKITTDAPDKKTVVFRLQGDSNDCYGWNQSSPFYPEHAPPPTIEHSMVQAEMVLSYDVQ